MPLENRLSIVAGMGQHKSKYFIKIESFDGQVIKLVQLHIEKLDEKQPEKKKIISFSKKTPLQKFKEEIKKAEGISGVILSSPKKNKKLQEAFPELDRTKRHLEVIQDCKSLVSEN